VEVEANERLTAAAGVALLLLLAAEGVTILFIRPLLPEHVFIGLLLVPPIVLKAGSTGWRFLRYYAGDEDYVRRGPPALPLRLLAPLVVVSTVAVFATGIALIVIGPRGGIVLGLHKASFVVWLAATGVHVLGHLRRLPRLAFAERKAPLLVLGTVAVGVVAAVLTYGYGQTWWG
jgi:hypothetical protein